MIGLVSLLFAFLFFLGLYAGLSVYLQRRREVSQRIQQYAGYQPAAVRKTPFWEILRNRFHELFAERNRRPGRPWNRKKLDLMMIQAGLPLLGKEYVAIAGGLAVLVFLVTAVAGRSLVTGLLGGILTLFSSGGSAAGRKPLNGSWRIVSPWYPTLSGPGSPFSRPWRSSPGKCSLPCPRNSPM